MAEQHKSKDNKVLVECMSVKGGDLPNDFGCYLNVEFDYSDMSVEDLQGLASEGSSIRVKAQAQLRKQTTAYLREHGVEGRELTPEIKEALKDKSPVKFDVSSDFESEGRTQDPVKRGTSAYNKMSADEKFRYLTETIGLDEETARISAYPVVDDTTEE